MEVNDAIKVIDYKNYLTQYNTGLEATLGLNIFPWWENREFISFNFADAKSSIPEVVTQNGSAFYYSTYNTFTLSKTINIFLNFWNSLPKTQGNVYSENRYSLSSGLKVALAKNKVQVNASVDDLLRSAVSKGKVYYQDFTQYYNNYYDSRRFSLSITYSFGKEKVKGNRKQINFKETQRAD